MIATNDELSLLEKWKRKLCLQEWRIKLLTHLHPEEMTVSNTAGCTEWSEAIKTARIEIINPACYGDRIVPFDFEKTLVHELLHLKFSFWCQNEDDVGDRVMHQMIDDLANHNMNVTDVAHAIFAHRNTVLYHLNKVKQQTGLDPRRFYDLVELVKMAQEVLESETEGV
jgi:hypothetical protein